MTIGSPRANTSCGSVCQAGADLVVGFLDLFLGCCARYAQDLVEVLLAAGRGTCVKGRFDTCKVGKRVSKYHLEQWSCTIAAFGTAKLSSLHYYLLLLDVLVG